MAPSLWNWRTPSPEGRPTWPKKDPKAWILNYRGIRTLRCRSFFFLMSVIENILHLVLAGPFSQLWNMRRQCPSDTPGWGISLCSATLTWGSDQTVTWSTDISVHQGASLVCELPLELTGWPAGSDWSGIFLAFALKFPHLGRPFNPEQTGIVGHLSGLPSILGNSRIFWWQSPESLGQWSSRAD